MSRNVFILGHKNPDADAICSAIGYAAYKQACGMEAVEAARCGNSNARIDAILKRFDVALPRFVGDVTPRVRDIMIRDVIKVHDDAICSEALEVIDRHDVRILPVVDERNRLKGTVSVFDMADHFIPKPRQERQLRHVKTSIDNIVRALKAEVIHAVEPERQEDLFLRVGAMDVRSFGRHYTRGSELARSSVIIVGDRYDIQHRSIQSGVRMLVITGGLPIEPDVVDMAKERGTSIIVSPDDSATTSWIIRSAGRVDQVMSEDYITFAPDEKVSSVRNRIATMKDAQAYMVVGDDGELLGVFTKTDMLKPSQTSLILVDHNELSQAVAGADQVEILEIVDHHRLGNPPTEQPILFLNAPVGSTSTLVGEFFRSQGVALPPPIAGVLMGGLLSDTLNLRGPTTTERDRQLLTWLEEVSGVDAGELAETIFSSGSIILSKGPEAALRSDLKVYREGEQSFSVSQIEELGYANFWQHREAITEALEQVRAEEQFLFSALLVTDINAQNSLLLVTGDESLIDAITYPPKEFAGIFELNNVVSRKKQLIPYLTTLLRQTGVAAA